jgi:molybdenum cofactor cytidylyltransferase
LTAPHISQVAALVLAAGSSRRMGALNKLLLPLRGEPLVRHAVHSAVAAGCGKVVVVLGHQAAEVQAALDGLPVRCVVNPAHDEGLGSSVRCGVARLGQGIEAVLCLLGDMPDVKPATLQALAAAYRPAGGVLACQPTCDGRRGNPLLWGAPMWPALAALQGDQGARGLLGGLGEQLALVPVSDPGVLLDLDTPEDWATRLSAPPPPAGAGRP